LCRPSRERSDPSFGDAEAWPATVITVILQCRTHIFGINPASALFNNPDACQQMLSRLILCEDRVDPGFDGLLGNLPAYFFKIEDEEDVIALSAECLQQGADIDKFTWVT
jgi:hypothetical protein